MADVNINKFRASVVRDGSKPSSPGFIVSEGQDPVNPPGTNNYVPYSGATANVELGEYGVEAGFITLDTTPTNTPTDQGTIFWDADDETVDIVLNGYTMKIGEDLFYPVKNQTGSTIAKGVAVRFNGTVGASGRLLIAPFIADGSVPSSRFMGVTAEEILNGEDGKVLYFGRVRGINTNAFNEGDILYASTTVAGGYQTAIPVAPNNIVQVAAVVTKSATVGTIFVRPTLGSNINKDEGVKIVSVADKNLLQYQSGTSLWENKSLSQVLGGTSAQFVKGDGSLDSTTYGTGTVTSVGLSSATSGVTIGSTPVTTSGTITIAIATASGSQNGLLSSTDWTTFNNKQNALTNPVTGTGTTNYLPKFTGSTTIGNSNIQDSGTLVSVGVAASFSSNITASGYITGAGTNPGGLGGSKFVLDWLSGSMRIFSYGSDASTNGGFLFNSQRSDGTNSLNFLSIASTGAATFNLGSGEMRLNRTGTSEFLKLNTYYLLSDGNDQLLGSVTGSTSIYSGNGVSPRLTITSGGQLLVGTSSTDSGISVDFQNLSSASSNVLVRAKNTTLNEDVGFVISGNSSGTQRDYIIGIQTIVNTPDLTFSGPTGFQWYVGGTERMRINSSGNVGIGTNSPVSNDGTSRTLQLGNRLVVQNVIGTQFLLGTNCYYDGVSWKYIAAAQAQAVRGTGESGTIQFSLSATGTAGGTITNMDGSDVKMVIHNNGNVLIGTTTNGASRLRIVGLPTSSAGLSSGDVWNDSGTLKIA